MTPDRHFSFLFAILFLSSITLLSGCDSGESSSPSSHNRPEITEARIFRIVDDERIEQYLLYLGDYYEYEVEYRDTNKDVINLLVHSYRKIDGSYVHFTGPEIVPLDSMCCESVMFSLEGPWQVPNEILPGDYRLDFIIEDKEENKSVPFQILIIIK